MKFLKFALTFAAALTVSPVVAQETVAITEFMNDPRGTAPLETMRRWVELYNFGSSAVTMNNWTVTNNAATNVSSFSGTIAPGDFVVITPSKYQFELDWLSGYPSAKVIEWSTSAGTGFVASGTSGQIVIKNGSGIVVWRVNHGSDDNAGYATYLTDTNNFSIRQWGSGTTSGIDRSGNDAASGTLGYESYMITPDEHLYSGETYSNSIHDWGAPLRGNYSGVSTAPTSRVINAQAAGTPFNAGVRGIALHDYDITWTPYWYAVPKANEVSDGSSIRGVTGGLYADQYDWKVRNNAPRPTTLEFLKYQRDNSARLYITANTRGLVEPDPDNPGKLRFYTTNTQTLANLAADWVRYTNRIAQIYRQGDIITDLRDQSILNSLVWSSSTSGDNWPKLLAPGETSVPKCMYWEIGNEPTISLTGGIGVTNGYALSAQDYYTRYKAITEAMLAEDPTIKVGPCIVNASREQQHLNLLFLDPDVRVDFVAYHPYGNMNDETSTTQRFLQANIHSVYAQQHDFAKAVRDNVTSNGRTAANVALVASEWNVSDWPSNEKELIGTMAHTIGSVESMFSFVRLGLDASHYWIWPAAQWDGFEYPIFDAYEMLRDHMGDTLLDSYAETGHLRLYATKNSATGAVALWGLNLSPTLDKSVQLSVTGLPAGTRPRLYTMGNPNGPTTLLSKNLPHWIPPGPANDVTWYNSVAGASADGFTVNLKAATLNTILFEPTPAVVGDWQLYAD